MTTVEVRCCAHPKASCTPPNASHDPHLSSYTQHRSPPSYIPYPTSHTCIPAHPAALRVPTVCVCVGGGRCSGQPRAPHSCGPHNKAETSAPPLPHLRPFCSPKAEPCRCARTHRRLSLHARCTHLPCTAHTHCVHSARTRTHFLHTAHTAAHTSLTLYAHCTHAAHAARATLGYPHVPSLGSTNQELLLGRLQLERRHSAGPPRLYPGRTAASSQSH